MNKHTVPEGDKRAHFLYRVMEPIKELMNDPKVVEISCNRPGVIFVERLGDNEMTQMDVPEFTSKEIEFFGQQVGQYNNQFVDSGAPLLSAALPDGERIQFVLPPAAPDGGTFSIRKQVINDMTLEDYRDSGNLDKVAATVGGLSDVDHALIADLEAGRIYEFIKRALAERVSMLISGGTSSGKTTFLNACLKSVDAGERIITLEDTRELFPPQTNCVHLIASKGDQGTAKVSIQQLLEASLRMRPDRLFVGEVRGAEAFSFLRAINTGHPGSMSTVHADTPMGAYEQLAMMVMQGGITSGYSKHDLMSYIQMVIPIVIQLRRVGGRRGVSEIFFARKPD